MEPVVTDTPRMKESKIKVRRVVGLLLGDIIILSVVTIYGFASHGTLGSAGLRILTTFLPLVFAWLLIAPHLGVFNPSLTIHYRDLWRPFWAMILAAPMAAWLRAVWLNAPILPVFVLVLGGTSAICLLVWRTVYLIIARERRN